MSDFTQFVRVMYTGNLYGPWYGQHVLISRILGALLIPQEDWSKFRLVNLVDKSNHRLAEHRLTIPSGLYELELRRSSEDNTTSNDGESVMKQLADLSVACQFNGDRQNVRHRLEQLNDQFQLKAAQTANREDSPTDVIRTALYEEIQSIMAAGRRPLIISPRYQLYHRSDFQSPGKHQHANHFANYARLTGRLAAIASTTRSGSGERRKHPSRSSATPNSGGNDRERCPDGPLHLQQIDLSQAISSFRIKLIDCMLLTESYKDEEITQYIDILAGLESRLQTGLQGSSRCHGTVRHYPVRQVVERMKRDFDLK